MPGKKRERFNDDAHGAPKNGFGQKKISSIRLIFHFLSLIPLQQPRAKGTGKVSVIMCKEQILNSQCAPFFRQYNYGGTCQPDLNTTRVVKERKGDQTRRARSE